MASISAEIIWLPLKKQSYVKQQFRDCLGVTLTNIVDKLNQSAYYEEKYVHIKCKLKLQQELKNCSDSLIHRWCNLNDIKGDHKWLSLDKDEIFKTYSIAVDKWIDICSLSFGTIVGLNQFVEHYGTTEQNNNKALKYKVTQIKALFEHDCEKMYIFFTVTQKGIDVKSASAATHWPHRFIIDYSDIDRMLISKQNSKVMDVYFFLSHPPLIYIVELPKNAEEKTYENWIHQTPDTIYTRKPSFADCSRSDIGLSSVLKLEFSIKNQLAASEKNSWDAICRLVQSCEKAKCFFSPISKIIGMKTFHSPKITVDHFNCIYALQSVLSRSREIVVQIAVRQEMKIINEKLNKYASQNPTALEKTLYEIFLSLEKKNIVIFHNALDCLFDKYKDINSEAKNQSESLIDIRRAILTPTKVIYLSPQPYFKCRFFRLFEAEYAIRIYIKDDNIDKLNYSLHGKSSDNNETLKVLKQQLLKGLKIGKRHYVILGCSSSHLREHGIIMYAEDSKGITTEDALKKCGKFDEIQKVPKYMARLGLLFSQAIDAVDIDSKYVTEVDDITIKNPNNSEQPYNFSDGIGKISEDLANMVYEKLNIEYNPSAMQIRYAGYKGMLTVWRDLKGKQIIFRKSMNKFSSDNDSLEILKTSKPRLVRLNRPFITILSQMGITDEIFLNLQNSMMSNLFKSLIDEEYAINMLKEHALLRLNYSAIHKFGIEVLYEPFFQSMMNATFKKFIDDLKTKTGILIPSSQGRTMFGVLDETETLKYGEVFVQYTKDIWSDKPDKDTVILKGDILVTKNPCMHPGDVRKFQAVDKPKLHYIKDCIVFPAEGPRPHPDEMAGSDLDGDEFSVIWMKELIFLCENFKAMDFPSVEVEDLNHPVGVADMVDFLCNYIKNDRVGTIAIAHLRWADYHSEGIFSDVCIGIAKKYAICLDAAKSGKTEHLSGDEQLEYYPDFLAKEFHNNTYVSKKILGQLYRRCKMVQLGFETVVSFPNYVVDPDLDYPGRENYGIAAKESLKKFNNEVSSILEQYGIETEGELFSGAILMTDKYINIKQDFNDLTIIDYRIKSLMNKMRKEFVSEFLEMEEGNEKTIYEILYNKYKEEVFQKASAWYMETHLQKGNKKYYGMPWMIYDVLNTLKNHVSNKDKKISRKTMVEKKLNELLKVNFPEIFNEEMTNSAEIWQGVFKIIHKCLTETSNDNICLPDTGELLNKIITEVLVECYLEMTDGSNDKKMSLSKTLVQVLRKLTNLIFSKPSSNQNLCIVPYMMNNQIIGLVAFGLLQKLMLLYNIKCSDFINLTSKLRKKIFRLSLEDEEFSERLVHSAEEVKDLLKKWTKVSNIEFRTIPNRREKWNMLVTVEGNKYALHHFEHIVSQKQFTAIIIRSIHPTV